MSSFDPLGLRPNDPLEQWRDFHEKQEREFAQARRERKQEEQHRADAIAANEAAQLRYALEARLAALEERHAHLEADVLDLARATSYGFNAIADQHIEPSAQEREELRDLKTEVAKLHSILTELREERAKGFQFAREKDAVADLPNFLPQRRIVN
jgi:hypothetical protein